MSQKKYSAEWIIARVEEYIDGKGSASHFSLILAMLFTPVLFQGITTPENFSEDYDKYVNKMQSKFGLF